MTLHLFKIGDRVRSIDMLTKGTVSGIDGELYRVTYQVWPGEPEQFNHFREDDLVDEETGREQFRLWCAERSLGNSYVREHLRRRQWMREEAKDGLRMAEQAKNFLARLNAFLGQHT